MKLIKNKYGTELRVDFGNTIFLINSGSIGVETTNEDLWNSGWRIGFTPVSFLLKKVGIYLFMATKEGSMTKTKDTVEKIKGIWKRCLSGEGIVRFPYLFIKEILLSHLTGNRGKNPNMDKGGVTHKEAVATTELTANVHLLKVKKI